MKPLRIQIVDHCTLKCRGCTSFANIAPKRFEDLGDFTRDIKALAATGAEFSEIGITGGEPLLHPDWLRFLEATRDAFPGVPLKLLTNGTRMHTVSLASWSMLHLLKVHIVVTRYPDLPARLVRRLRLDAYAGGVKLTVLYPRSVSMFAACLDFFKRTRAGDALAKCTGCVSMRGGKLYPCLFASNGGIFNDHFNMPAMIPTTDNIDVAGKTKADIDRFLNAPYYSVCRMCRVPGRRAYFKWSQKAAPEWGDWDVSCCDRTIRERFVSFWINRLGGISIGRLAARVLLR